MPNREQQELWHTQTDGPVSLKSAWEEFVEAFNQFKEQNEQNILQMGSRLYVANGQRVHSDHDRTRLLSRVSQLESDCRMKDEALRKSDETLRNLHEVAAEQTSGAPDYGRSDAAKVIQAALSPAPQPDAVQADTDKWHRLLVAAKLLYSTAEGCAVNHYSGDFEQQGLPGWLLDCKVDIEAVDGMATPPPADYVVSAAKEIADGLGIHAGQYQLIEALAAANLLRQSAPVEAAGMREPDEAMLVAAREWSRRKFGKPIGNDAARGCWQAMFDAAPTDAAATKLDLHPVARAVADADRYLNEECVSRWKKGGAFKATEELQRLAKDMFSHCPLLQADAVMRARKLREYANAVRRDHLISGSVFAEFLEETANIFDGGEQ